MKKTILIFVLIFISINIFSQDKSLKNLAVGVYYGEINSTYNYFLVDNFETEDGRSKYTTRKYRNQKKTIALKNIGLFFFDKSFGSMYIYYSMHYGFEKEREETYQMANELTNQIIDYSVNEKISTFRFKFGPYFSLKSLFNVDELDVKIGLQGGIRNTTINTEFLPLSFTSIEEGYTSEAEWHGQNSIYSYEYDNSSFYKENYYAFDINAGLNLYYDIYKSISLFGNFNYYLSLYEGGEDYFIDQRKELGFNFGLSYTFQ